MDNNNIGYIISEDNIRIENSYTITKEGYIKEILTNLKNKISDHIVFQNVQLNHLLKNGLLIMFYINFISLALILNPLI